MNIAVVGLGLIGASFCKALTVKTGHRIFGIDIQPETVQKAEKLGMIECGIDSSELKSMDLTIIALYPEDAIRFLMEHTGQFRRGSIVIDVCGVKAKVVRAVEPAMMDAGVRYVGAHPMAGREFSGIDYATADLYSGASFILTPTEQTDPAAVEILSALALELGFRKTVVATPEEHDQVIAYTSQLAHVVSNAYIKSPTLKQENGFSAGSFKDLTRVAKCNPGMWTSLFLDNRDALLAELDTILLHLTEYRQALANEDADTLFSLLKDGNDRKEWSLFHEE
ncbi:MAG: prephenate dehydrogenase/arogenate dehydrogenase family protein [Clostridiales bacterium]|nr:MAG: prephenate dehydrogenase/arogenate dehydrogenase family protein [Clostridiales bacterium]